MNSELAYFRRRWAELVSSPMFIFERPFYAVAAALAVAILVVCLAAIV
jgi:hypothetical protein